MKNKPIKVEAEAYAAAGLAIAAVAFLAFPLQPLTGAALLLPLLALFAEFIRMPVSANGMRFSFPLPFLAGVAVVGGPFSALLVDVAITIVAGVVPRAAPWRWVVVNASAAAISCGGAAGAYAIASAGWEGSTLPAIVFCVVYGAINYALVARLESRIARSVRPKTARRPHTALGALAERTPALAVYGLLTVAVAVLTERGLYALIPATLLPVLALRASIALKARLYEQYCETISGLSLMLQHAHPYTHGHIERVARISEEVALRLGLSPRRARLVREASVLHDIGKIAVDETILDKPGALNRFEMDHIRRHAVYGAMILAPVEPFREMVSWIKHHHERPDGKGYPSGLQDVEIPLESKIIAVVDAFDAMAGGQAPSERRSYREPMTQAEALIELERCAGTQFDPAVVQAFVGVVTA